MQQFKLDKQKASWGFDVGGVHVDQAEYFGKFGEGKVI